MRYRDIVAGREAEMATRRAVVESVRAAYSARIRPEVGMSTADERAAMPHAVECPGLTVHDLGPAFADALQGRRLWCRENCAGPISVEPIRDDTTGHDTGRRFLFSDEADAAMFRRRWF